MAVNVKKFKHSAGRDRLMAKAEDRDFEKEINSWSS